MSVGFMPLLPRCPGAFLFHFPFDFLAGETSFIVTVAMKWLVAIVIYRALSKYSLVRPLRFRKRQQ